MNWFRKHLNWTYVFGLLVGGSLFEGGDILVEAGDRLVGLIELWVGVIILWFVTIWVLRQKGRSLLTLLWGFLGILPIIVLCMKNKKVESQSEVNNKIGIGCQEDITIASVKIVTQI